MKMSTFQNKVVLCVFNKAIYSILEYAGRFPNAILNGGILIPRSKMTRGRLMVGNIQSGSERSPVTRRMLFENVLECKSQIE